MANPLYGQNIADQKLDRAQQAFGGTLDVETLSGDRTLTSQDFNRVYVLNKAAGIAVTLPSVSASDSGKWLKFANRTSVTSNSHTITAQSGDLLEGYAFISKATDYVANMKYFAADESDDLIITLNGSTTGGLIGDEIFMQVNDNGYWTVQARLFGSGTLATPFS